MKVCGFTIVRNAIRFDYPVIESISSILDLCDAFYVSVGKSDDNTLELIQSINSNKIHIIESVWDDSKRKGGQVLAEETNKCFFQIPSKYDWCFYLQADEVVHEKYLPTIYDAMHKYLNNMRVEGLLFKYLHFYGSYDYVGDSRRWYRKEIRIIRNDKQIHSFRDAQGFKKNNKKLKVKEIEAYIYHYGWVKHPINQQDKQKHFNKYWHDDSWIEKHVGSQLEYDYSKYDSLKIFNETHPQVMLKRINLKNWHVTINLNQKNYSNLKDKFLNFIEKYTKWRIGEYKNYRKI